MGLKNNGKFYLFDITTKGEAIRERRKARPGPLAASPRQSRDFWS